MTDNVPVHSDLSYIKGEVEALKGQIKTIMNDLNCNDVYSSNTRTPGKEPLSVRSVLKNINTFLETMDDELSVLIEVGDNINNMDYRLSETANTLDFDLEGEIK